MKRRALPLASVGSGYAADEVGYFIPSITKATDERCVKIDGKDRCKVAIHTTGDARAVAGLK